MDHHGIFSRLGLLISLFAAIGCARPSLAAFGPGSGLRDAARALQVVQPGSSEALGKVAGPRGFASSAPFRLESALALAGDPRALSEREAPRMVQVRVQKSNLRRMQWGYALTIVGILGIMAGGVGMVIASSSADKDKGPTAQANPALARRYRRQHRAGLAMLFSGLGVGISGMIAGPLLIRSAKRRQQAHWMNQSPVSLLFPGRRAVMP